MYSYGPPHMAEQKQDDQLEHTYISYRMNDREKWRERSGISMQAARHDDDDIYIYIYMYKGHSINKVNIT